jgi:hypothetical protein
MSDTLNEEATASEKNRNDDDDGTTSPHSASPSDLYLCTAFTTKSCLTREPVIFMREQINLESHQLVWLDATIENRDNDNPVVIKDLRQIIGYTKIFNNTDECLSYLKHADISITTFLVCSGHLGRLIVPQVCHFKNIRSIYIYCENQEVHQQWALNYSKVSSSLKISTSTRKRIVIEVIGVSSKGVMILLLAYYYL